MQQRHPDADDADNHRGDGGDESPPRILISALLADSSGARLLTQPFERGPPLALIVIDRTLLNVVIDEKLAQPFKTLNATPLLGRRRSLENLRSRPAESRDGAMIAPSALSPQRTTMRCGQLFNFPYASTSNSMEAICQKRFLNNAISGCPISGYHMAVVAGVVFFALRAFLALIPGLSERAPIKKYAAFAALLVTAFYLVLSGAEVATQRSFIMIAVVLLGVLFDRPTLTMRTLTIAAVLVLFFVPEAVVHPSFQTSFAATLALIAGYERSIPRARAGTDSSLGALAALWGVNEIVGLTAASLLAGLATTPYAAYHFHRAAPYDVLANLLAMPVVSAWVMPMGILGVLAIPFGFDAECWRQMGYGIEWMDAVALWVASLPGEFGRVTSFGAGPLLLGTASLLVISLLKTPLLWSGVLLAALATV